MIFQESETVELKSMVVDDPDGTALQISNMVRDAIKPDLTMFFHYETLNEDGLEFTSIGGLVSGVTLNDVLMGISVCRNMKLANVFYRLELIEAYGTGILNMKEAYSGTGKEPKIEISDNAFKVILPNLNVHTNQEKQSVNKIGEYLAEEAVIDLAKRQGTFTRKDVEKELEISQTTCGRLLRRMTDRMQIVQEGKGKNTRYCISE